MKRFTDTEIWTAPWFHRLGPELKLAWKFICDDCDCAGIFTLNMTLLNAFIGGNLTEEEVLEAFDGRIEQISDDKWFILKFARFQYGDKFCEQYNPKSGIHRGVAKALEKASIPLDRVFDSLPDTLSHSLSDTLSHRVQDRVKEKDIYITSNKESNERGDSKGEKTGDRFVDFWDVYPRKVGKAPALKKWQAKKLDSEADKIIAAVERQKRHLWAGKETQYIPHPQTWLNQERWEDDVSTEPVLNMEAVEPIKPSVPEGWERALAELKETNPMDNDLYAANPAWGWDAQAPKIKSLIRRFLQKAG